MPGSQTAPGSPDTRVGVLVMLPSTVLNVSAPGTADFAARWLAYAHPCQRFACILTDTCA